MAYSPANNAISEIAAGSSFAHGTDTTITLKDTSTFPTGGGFIRIDDGSEYAIYEYTGISAPDLTGLSLGKSKAQSVSSYTFSEGTEVRLTISAGYLDQVINGTAVYADLVFEERTCEICGEEFEKDQMVALIVNKIGEDEDGEPVTHTVPVHLGCANK